MALVCFWGVSPSPLIAAEVSQEIGRSPSESQGTVKEFLDNALNSERSNMVEIEDGLKRWEALQRIVAKEIETYRIQNSAHNNLLLVSQIPVEELQTALNSNRLLIKSLSERITEFNKIGSIATNRMQQLTDRIAIAEKQLIDLDQETLPEDDRRAMREKLNNLLGILQQKKHRGKAFLGGYNTLFEQLNRLMTDLEETRRRLENRLQLQVKINLYERTTGPFGRLSEQNLMAEFVAIRARISGIFGTAFWRQQWINYQRSGGVFQTIFLLLFISAVVFRRKLRRYVRTTEMQLEGPAWHQRRMALVILRRSFVLICAAVLLWLFDLLKLPHINISLSSFLNKAVFALLLIRWMTDFLQYNANGSSSTLITYIQKRLLAFLKLLRLMALAFLLLVLVVGSESLLVWVARLTIEVVLFAWVLRFWRDLEPVAAQSVRQGEPLPPAARSLLIRIWSYLVVGGALLMELIGYGALAGYWLVSWAETFLLALWAYIGWQAIQEWYAAQRSAVRKGDDTGFAPVAAPLGWFMVQMARLLWLGAVLSGALLVWSSTDFMVITLSRFFGLAFSVGSLSVSVKGLLLAVIIICLTHLAARLGQSFLREKVLDSRDLERGLRDSIVTITTYVVWGLGLLLTLGVMGVNATSLAVVAGALSIGIGFGLQNIFNNFISGLILLFERPIQVGDYVEVNGLWAEVKQINVRATIVQTFDNASVIIPNSDFISQQVTNWSFKDPRMRRQVDVGVAYGSDIELVRQSLLDIAAQIPQILKYPRPDVLFMDHGDSALLFRLRFWTHVDNYWSTTTDVRFALDRRFRELGIEIAFPQRDLHIRSVDPGVFSGASTMTSAAPSPEQKTSSDASEPDSH